MREGPADGSHLNLKRRTDLKFVQDNLWLILIAVASGLGLLWPLVQRRLSGVPQVGVSQAVQLINRRDAVVIDVREASEYQRGHLRNARHVPLSQLKSRLGELDKWKDKPVLVHCATGNRSHGACVTLRKAGFKEVFNLQGGIGAWQQAGMPVEK
jgi:rhodanese-related sulfurtransferase